MTSRVSSFSCKSNTILKTALIPLDVTSLVMLAKV